MSDLDVKPDVSGPVASADGPRSSPAPQQQQMHYDAYDTPYRRSRRAVLVFEDDPDFGEFLGLRPPHASQGQGQAQARHPSLIQYPQSAPPPQPQALQRPSNLGHSPSPQPQGQGYQSVELSQVERPSAARPWPAPPAEYAGQPRTPASGAGGGGGGVNPLVVLGIFAVLALAIGAFVFFFDKKMKQDEIGHIQLLVRAVVDEYKEGNRVPDQLKEVADTIEHLLKAYGVEPVDVAEAVQKTRVVAAEL